MAIYWVDIHLSSPIGGSDGTTGVGTEGSYSNPYDIYTSIPGLISTDEIRVKATPEAAWITPTGDSLKFRTTTSGYSDHTLPYVTGKEIRKHLSDLYTGGANYTYNIEWYMMSYGDEFYATAYRNSSNRTSGSSIIRWRDNRGKYYYCDQTYYTYATTSSYYSKVYPGLNKGTSFYQYLNGPIPGDTETQAQFLHSDYVLWPRSDDPRGFTEPKVNSGKTDYCFPYMRGTLTSGWISETVRGGPDIVSVMKQSYYDTQEHQLLFTDSRESDVLTGSTYPNDYQYTYMQLSEELTAPFRYTELDVPTEAERETGILKNGDMTPFVSMYQANFYSANGLSTNQQWRYIFDDFYDANGDRLFPDNAARDAYLINEDNPTWGTANYPSGHKWNLTPTAAFPARLSRMEIWLNGDYIDYNSSAGNWGAGDEVTMVLNITKGSISGAKWYSAYYGTYYLKDEDGLSSGTGGTQKQFRVTGKASGYQARYMVLYIDIPIDSDLEFELKMLGAPPVAGEYKPMYWGGHLDASKVQKWDNFYSNTDMIKGLPRESFLDVAAPELIIGTSQRNYYGGNIWMYGKDVEVHNLVACCGRRDIAIGCTGDFKAQHVQGYYVKRFIAPGKRYPHHVFGNPSSLDTAGPITSRMKDPSTDIETIFAYQLYGKAFTSELGSLDSPTDGIYSYYWENYPYRSPLDNNWGVCKTWTEEPYTISFGGLHVIINYLYNDYRGVRMSSGGREYTSYRDTSTSYLAPLHTVRSIDKGNYAKYGPTEDFSSVTLSNEFTAEGLIPQHLDYFPDGGSYGFTLSYVGYTHDYSYENSVGAETTKRVYKETSILNADRKLGYWDTLGQKLEDLTTFNATSTTSNSTDLRRNEYYRGNLIDILSTSDEGRPIQVLIPWSAGMAAILYNSDDFEQKMTLHIMAECKNNIYRMLINTKSVGFDSGSQITLSFPFAIIGGGVQIAVMALQAFEIAQPSSWVSLAEGQGTAGVPYQMPDGVTVNKDTPMYLYIKADTANVSKLCIPNGVKLSV